MSLVYIVSISSKLQSISFIVLLVLACQTFANVFDDLGFEGLSHLSRRQTGDCVTLCTWMTNIVTLCTSGTAVENDACICEVAQKAGSLVKKCADCIRPLNATLAGDLVYLDTVCNTPGTPTITCIEPCRGIREAFQTCTSGDVPCVCPIILAEGPMCSHCLASNGTEAGNVDVAMSYCVTKGFTAPASTTQTPTSTM